MAGEKLSAMDATQLEELWIQLAAAPKHFQDKMRMSAVARSAVGKELKTRGYTYKMMAVMVDMTPEAVRSCVKQREVRQSQRERTRNITKAREEAEAARREVAILKALHGLDDGSTPPSPI